jgi:hypothetical protein
MICFVNLPRDTAAQRVDRGSISVTVDRQLSCEIDPVDGLYEHVLYVTEQYTNATSSVQEFFDTEKSGAVLFKTIDDAAENHVWLNFVSDYESPEFGKGAVRMIPPGGVDVRKAVIIMTARKATTSASRWPLSPGVHFVQVRTLRLRLAAATEQTRDESSAVWVDLRSEPFSIDFPDGARLGACPSVY